jgi:hypothetical protein
VYGYCQKDSSFFFNEYGLSVNRTFLLNNDFNRYTGFGISVCHSTETYKQINVTFGLEFNSTHYYDSYMYNGHFANWSDVTFQINSFSFPLYLHMNLDKESTLFLETGTVPTLNFIGITEGTFSTYLPYASTQNKHVKNGFFENMSYLRPGIFPCIGFGLKVPFNKFDIIIKADYNWGLNFIYDQYDDKASINYFRLQVGVKI